MYAKVYIEITNICNMSCSFCHGHSRTPGRMTREQFGQILQRLQGKTDHIYYHLITIYQKLVQKLEILNSLLLMVELKQDTLEMDL